LNPDTIVTAGKIIAGGVAAGAVMPPVASTSVFSTILTYVLPLVVSTLSHLLLNLFTKKSNVNEPPNLVN
jgi:hypothetical protein